MNNEFYKANGHGTFHTLYGLLIITNILHQALEKAGHNTLECMVRTTHGHRENCKVALYYPTPSTALLKDILVDDQGNLAFTANLPSSCYDWVAQHNNENLVYVPDRYESKGQWKILCERIGLTADPTSNHYRGIMFKMTLADPQIIQKLSEVIGFIAKKKARNLKKVKS